MKLLRRGGPEVWNSNMSATTRCRKSSLLAILLSSTLRECYAETTTAGQASASFVRSVGTSLRRSAVPRRFHQAAQSIALRPSPRSVLRTSSTGSAEHDQPSQPVKRGRGRPPSARVSQDSRRRDGGRGETRQTPATATGRDRDSVGSSDSQNKSVVDGSRGSLQRPESGVSRDDPQGPMNREQYLAKSEEPENLLTVRSELEELGRYADALAKAGELEDSIAIKRQLEQLRVFSPAAGGTLSEAHLDEVVRQQLDRETRAEEQAAVAERQRWLQDVERNAIEDEMRERHTKRQRKQREQILASQQRRRLKQDAEEQALEARVDDSNYGEEARAEVEGSDDTTPKLEAGKGGGGEEGEMGALVEDDLPSALTLLANVEALLGEDDDDNDDASVRLPHYEELDSVPENEEATLLREMSEQNLLHNRDLRQVMVVIGKHLIRDQVTVEYASRIRRLVQGMKSGRLRPDLVCFTGGRVWDNKVADASVGYVFFRHLCEQQGVDLYNTGILVESESTCTKEAMMNVVREVSRLEREEMQQDMDKEQEEEMQQKEAKGVGERVRKKPRQKYHFTLISNEYHLSRVIMVHEISETVSLLSPLKQLDASWGYEHVPYPYACYDDANKKFQADVYKTLEELVPLQVNVQAVARREEFFQEENYASLTHVRARVGDFIRQVHSSSGPLARHMNLVDLQRAAEQGRRGKMGTFPAGSVTTLRLDEALEWAAGALAKIQEIIEPAATRRNSVSLRAWAMCAALLEKAILQGQMAADPDRPLYPHEWGLLEDENPQEDAQGDSKATSRRARETLYAVLEEEGSLLGGGRTSSPPKKKKVFYWEGKDAAAQMEKGDEDLPDSGLEWMEELGLKACQELTGRGAGDADRDKERAGLDGAATAGRERVAPQWSEHSGDDGGGVNSAAGASWPTTDDVIGKMLKQRQRQRGDSSTGAAEDSDTGKATAPSTGGALPRGRRRNNNASSPAPQSPSPSQPPSVVPITRRTRTSSRSGGVKGAGSTMTSSRTRSRGEGGRVKSTKDPGAVEAEGADEGGAMKAVMPARKGRGRA